MIAGLIFTFNRVMELITLIPTMGILAYFVDKYVKANELTPNYILVPFIIVVLAVWWALLTLIRHDSTRRSSFFCAFVDACFLGAFIASAFELRNVAKEDCLNITGGIHAGTSEVQGGGTVYINYTAFGINANKTCAMLKTCFAFCIMNCIFFSCTSFMLWFMHRGDDVVVEKVYRRSSHGSRRGHSHSRHRHSSDSRRHGYV